MLSCAYHLLVLCFAFASPACPFVSVCASSQRMGTVAVVAKNLMKEILQYSNLSNIFCRSISLYTECSIYLIIKLCSYPACVRGRVFFASVFMHFDHRWKSRHTSVGPMDPNVFGMH
jgi:hypothetical protein